MGGKNTNIVAIAGLLSNDGGLMYEWEFLHHSLGLDCDIAEIKSKCGTEANSFATLFELLYQFVIERSEEATINELANALDVIGHIPAKDALLQKFDESSRLVCPEEVSSFADVSVNMQTFEDQELMKKTTSKTISLLKVIPSGSEAKSRVFIVVSYLSKILSEIGTKPVAIISINGKQRAGKSFIATQFVKYLKSPGNDGWLDGKQEACFPWRDDFDRVTSGIQICKDYFEVKCNGKEIAVIIMDTQGLHDCYTDPMENAIIFGLSVLLSSVFIYNEKHTAEDSLDFLWSFLEFAKLALSGNGSDAKRTATNAQNKFQKLIVLLRDWMAQKHFPFGYHDDISCPEGNKNLNKKLFDVSAPGMSSKSVKTRNGIQNSFEETIVYAMSGPGNQPPDDTEPGNWDKTFRECIVDFTSKLLSSENIANSSKRLFGEEVSGKDLIPYMEKWAETLPKMEKMVEFKSIFETTANLFFKKKINGLVEEYKQEMKEILEEYPDGLEVEMFEEFHEELLNDIQSKFLFAGGLYGGEEVAEKYTPQLIELITCSKIYFADINITLLNEEVKRKRQEMLFEQKLAAEREEALHRAETLRREKEEAEQEAAIAKAKKDALEDERRKAKEAEEREELENARSRRDDAKEELREAKNRLKEVIDNKNNYKKRVKETSVTYTLGFIPSSESKWVDVFDKDQYEAALAEANKDVKEMEKELKDAKEEVARLAFPGLSAAADIFSIGVKAYNYLNS